MRRFALLVLVCACSKESATAGAPNPANEGESKERDAKQSDANEPDANAPEPGHIEPKGTAVPEPAPEPGIHRAAFSPDGLEPTNTWPFFAWDSARAYAFNLRAPGPGHPLRVYDEAKGWNPTISIDKELSRERADRAVALLNETQGEMLVSKCPYPRHAVVLFANGVPVGSINVCFTCEDILIWPPWSRDPGWELKKQNMYPKLMKRHASVLGDWKRFFSESAGIPDDWEKI
jgi:hypothetical protein